MTEQAARANVSDVRELGRRGSKAVVEPQPFIFGFCYPLRKSGRSHQRCTLATDHRIAELRDKR